MNTPKLILLALLMASATVGLCQPIIAIDGNNILADENASAGLKLPAWLKSGQTLAKGQSVYSISVIEFTVNGTALDYSQNLSVTTVQTVPANKVWKIEAVLKAATSSPLKNDGITETSANQGSMSIDACKTACVALGAGWRIPTFDEENYIYSGALGTPTGGWIGGKVWTSTPWDTRVAATPIGGDRVVLDESTGAWNYNSNWGGSHNCRCVR